ncbi:heparin-binding EGF-like growth factor a [Leuresthes tenuis]|uniref:heparin-binding EGF-like growth factor a n=1 Tax=Leuresthes tenuis TaxID=355514 RepID=UPI003B500CFE
MRIFPVALLLVHALVVSRLASGAAVDRHEKDRQRRSAASFITLLPSRDGRVEEDSRSGVATTEDYGREDKEEDDYVDDYYDDEYDMSGDYEPRVAMSSKPKDLPSRLLAESTEVKKRKGKGKRNGKGKGNKRNPCLKKYKDFCIHGTCQYLRHIRAPSCVCHPEYSGERCEFFTLPSHSPEGYSRTTALAVVAVVLSSVCLIIIGLLLMLRFHKRGAYDVESEEKVKLGLSSDH